MDLTQTINNNTLVLTEASVIEALRRSGDIRLHPRLENALLIYDKTGRNKISALYNGYISIAQEADLPITLASPTWRANYERLSTVNVNFHTSQFSTSNRYFRR
jgi:hypothetical protein